MTVQYLTMIDEEIVCSLITFAITEIIFSMFSSYSFKETKVDPPAITASLAPKKIRTMSGRKDMTTSSIIDSPQREL